MGRARAPPFPRPAALRDDARRTRGEANASWGGRDARALEAGGGGGGGGGGGLEGCRGVDLHAVSAEWGCAAKRVGRWGALFYINDRASFAERVE